MSQRKKHCARHYRFVVGCPDCEALNLDDEVQSRDDEPEVSNNTIPSRDDEIPRPRRFQYRPPPSAGKKKAMLFVSIIIAISIAIGLIYSLPLFLAKVSLNQQLYFNKAGGIDYWQIKTLGYWSTNFILNWTGLIGAILGVIIFCIPPEKTIIQLVGTRFGWGKPSNFKAIKVIIPFGFLLFYFIGQSLDAFANFSLAMYYLQNGVLKFDINAVFVPFYIYSDLDAITMEMMFMYTNIIDPIIGYLFFLVILRFIINIIQYSYLARNDFLIASNVFLIIAVFFGIGIENLPYEQINGIFVIQSLGYLIGFIGFGVLGIGLYYYGKNHGKRNIFFFQEKHKKTVGIAASILIFVVFVPSITVIPQSIYVQTDKPSWERYIWDIGLRREVAWTSTAAGLDMFETKDLHQFIEGGISSDIELLNTVRQFDKNIAFRTMKERTILPFETLADSDIIYVNRPMTKGEYWVAPKSIDVAHLGSDPTRKHTEIFDHVEGFFALDTTTGQLLPADQYPTVFGVNADYPIFFGEHQDLITAATSEDQITYLTTDAYDVDVLLYTEWGNNTEHYKYRFDGQPDGNLTGMQAFWMTWEMGLISEAFNGQNKSFLINRNIITRVESILLPGIKIDSDPYLIFDYNAGKMYYGLSLYTSITLGLFSRSPILRFLGVCLIDVKSGDLSFYQNPALVRSNSDPTYFAWKHYFSVYPWITSLPDWLKGQIRYPEDLIETQLEYQYKYHVRDSSTWYAQQDFFERPSGSDLYYVEMDLGQGIEFVGVDLVKRIGTEASVLAGMYVVRHGDHFGKCIFYKEERRDSLIGPTTAQNQLNNVQKTVLDVIQNKRFGNKLLYPLGDSLYYFIPIYTTSDRIETLVYAGLVNAYTKEVGFGQNVFEAYKNLGIEDVVDKGENITLTIDADKSYVHTNTSYANFKVLVENLNLNDSHPQWNVTVHMKIFADDGANITVFGASAPNSTFTWGAGFTGYNYTVANWTGANGLNAGEGRIFYVKLRKDPGVYQMISLWYQFELKVNDQVVYSTPISILSITNSIQP